MTKQEDIEKASEIVKNAFGRRPDFPSGKDYVDEVRGHTKQEEIREGLARKAYLWKSFMEKNSIEPFDKLTEEERKPYYVLAYQLSRYLHSKKCRIEIEIEVPKVEEDYPFERLDEQAKMLKWHNDSLEPLIKEGK